MENNLDNSLTENVAPIISNKLLEEIPCFENFFEAAGFKRIYGAIYGVLVLSPRPLASQEIEEVLNISQSAVSQAAKILIHFGAIESCNSSIPRQRHYFPKENSLNIVSSIIRKREQQHIEDFKMMSERILDKIELEGSHESDVRIKRVESINATCSIANSLIDFIVYLGNDKVGGRYVEIAQGLPKILETLIDGKESLNVITASISEKIKSSVFKNIGKNIGGIK